MLIFLCPKLYHSHLQVEVVEGIDGSLIVFEPGSGENSTPLRDPNKYRKL